MNTLDRATADEYASWFRCLSDGTRVHILNVVASAEHPLTVGEIVAAVGKSQSTVSRHLQVLADDRFVFLQVDGIRTYVRVNDTCMTALPEAAARIMGQPLEVALGTRA
jgi:DNA-binding transcriptional ArsR family regulator